MIATAKKACGFGVLACSLVTLWSVAGQLSAADFQQPLQPYPQASVPTNQANQQPAGSYAEGAAPPAATVTGTEEAEFVGLPILSPPGRVWLRADYLMWWTSGRRLPPLVTTSPQGTAQANAGVLGAAGTQILFGGDTVGDEGRSGYRTTIGMWLDDCHIWDVEFDYFNLGEQPRGFASQLSTGNPILARPFFDVQNNRQASELVAFPGVVSGSVDVATKDYFQSAGADLSYNLCSCNACCDPCDPCDGPSMGPCCLPLLYGCRTDLLVGFRYYNLSDAVGIHENLIMPIPDPTHPNAPSNATFDIHDNFHARNDFYGSELGLRTQLYRGRWSLDILTKIAMGNTHEVVTIGGQTVVTASNQTPQIYNAGTLALGTNSGTFNRDSFTLIPQLGLDLGFQVNCNWRAYVGYNIIYWGSVVQAGEQIDLNVDPRNIPPTQAGGLPFPAFPGRTSSFWAQGVNVGTEFRF